MNFDLLQSYCEIDEGVAFRRKKTNMTRNIGGADRIFRIVLGLVLLSLLFLLDGNGRWWGLIGFVPLVTGLAAACPLYSIFGFSTCRAKGDRQ